MWRLQEQSLLGPILFVTFENHQIEIISKTVSFQNPQNVSNCILLLFKINWKRIYWTHKEFLKMGTVGYNGLRRQNFRSHL